MKNVPLSAANAHYHVTCFAFYQVRFTKNNRCYSNEFRQPTTSAKTLCFRLSVSTFVRPSVR